MIPYGTEAIMTARAIRNGWIGANWTDQERREVIDKMLEGVRKGKRLRDRTGAARVLVALERNVVSADRNAIVEQGQELGAATDRLRAALSNPEARNAMAALASGMMRQAPPVEFVANEAENQELAVVQNAQVSEFDARHPGEQLQYASWGGTTDMGDATTDAGGNEPGTASQTDH